jgi:hypothetical protein
MNLGVLPVFPLRNPCFPGHKIALRVFEDRYVHMLKDIADKPFFVISMISTGDEVGPTATPYRVGTLVEFDAIDRQGDFQIIRPKGRQRVYLETFDRETKPYLQAQCRAYEDDVPAVEATGVEATGVEATGAGAPGAGLAGAKTADRLPELEANILKMATVLGPEESRGIRDVMEGIRIDMDRENFSLFLCGCLHLPPIYLQRLLESKSLPYRMENALNLLSQRE